MVRVSVSAYWCYGLGYWVVAYAHHREAEFARADHRIHVVHLVELADFEEEHRVEVLALQVPPLAQARRLLLEERLRHVQRARLELRVLRAPLFPTHNAPLDDCNDS